MAREEKPKGFEVKKFGHPRREVSPEKAAQQAYCVDTCHDEAREPCLELCHQACQENCRNALCEGQTTEDYLLILADQGQGPGEEDIWQGRSLEFDAEAQLLKP